MSNITAETIKNALSRVIDRDTGVDVVSSNMISGIVIRGDRVGFVITIDAKDKERKAYLQKACEEQVRLLPGVDSVTAVLTAQSESENSSPEAKKSAVWNTNSIEGVKKIIAVASGKGGVGKSTTAVNLALSLQKKGLRVGLLDADIYGPSIPRMMGLANKKPDIVDNKMVPPESYGIQCMSMGFITGDDAAIMRGPMISKTLHQLLRFTAWNDLDILLVDMPPGTGDIHLSMVQAAPLAGAIIVTTPQQVAVMDARKSLQMFQKVEVPVLGVIENMSGGIFGSGGGKSLAEEMHVPFLGEIPMDVAIVAASDGGTIYSGKHVEAYGAIAAFAQNL